MRNIVLFVLTVCLARYGYGKFQRRALVEAEADEPAITKTAPFAEKSSFTCDGRIYCSQMHSCVEATYFPQHCPGAKMDGNNDGVPCEKQWCQ